MEKSPQSTQKNHAGFTMLEVLVAIVVLSIGLLGLAGLQIAGLRYNNNASYRSLATQQVYDMADRMRANLAGVTAGNYDNISGVGADPACISVSCTTAQMAATDQYQWNTANQNLLPNGAGTVCRDSDPTDATACDGIGKVFTINLSWTEIENTASRTLTFQTRFQP